MTITGYRILKKLYASSNSLVYRALREQDDFPVILKIMDDYQTVHEIAKCRQEYEITASLGIEGVIKPYNIENIRNTQMIVFEDFGAESLKLLSNSKKYSLEEFLKIAIRIAGILGEIHAANIMHKDINPSNIVMNPETGQIKIIDFGISTILPREDPEIKNPEVLEGTLPYISPEQTGRMNRSLDYRTDFYSLGASFYEMLTGETPFGLGAAMELVHCHIAKTPVPPHELSRNRGIK